MFTRFLSTDLLVHILNVDRSYAFTWRATSALLLSSKEMADAVSMWRSTVQVVDFLPTWTNARDDESHFEARTHLLKTIVRWFPNAHTLVLNDFCFVNNQVVQGLLEAEHKFERVNRLEIVENDDGKLDLTGEVMHIINKHLPKLTELSIRSSELTSRSIVAIKCNLLFLEVVCFIACSKLTDDSILHMTFGYTCKLRQFVITGSQITDDGILRLTKNCKTIEVLNISDSSKITDASMKHIASTYPNMQSICLRHCENITDDGVAHLARGCKHLRHIDLSLCSKLTHNSIDALMNHCVNLETIPQM
jgi:F-box/leucine-rich repeat protein 2/20